MAPRFRTGIVERGFVIEAEEIHKLAEVEDRHWWYRERRVLLDRELRRLAATGVRPGRALDVGAAAGGNTRVLAAHGWAPLALEYGAEGAGLAATRGLAVVRADARRMPVASDSCGLVVAYDVLEHIEDDALAAREISRVLAPGGVALIAVPADMRLWSEHDVAVSHFRRYDRGSLTALVTGAGLRVDAIESWNVLLRPAVSLHRWRRRPLPPTGTAQAGSTQARTAQAGSTQAGSTQAGSDLDNPSTLINATLGAIIAAERYLPVGRFPGVSLLLRARRLG